MSETTSFTIRREYRAKTRTFACEFLGGLNFGGPVRSLHLHRAFNGPAFLPWMRCVEIVHWSHELAPPICDWILIYIAASAFYLLR